MNSYVKVERLLEKLILELYELFSESEIQEVTQYIDVGEYKLALETTIDIFIEEDKCPNESVFLIINKLAAIMGEDAKRYANKLKAWLTEVKK